MSGKLINMNGILTKYIRVPIPNNFIEISVWKPASAIKTSISA
jgi:hypothetical protein